MQIAGCMRRRMQYAPTGLRLTSTEKEYYPCGWQDICGGICNMPLLGYDQLLPIKNTNHADGRVHIGAYAFTPLLDDE